MRSVAIVSVVTGIVLVVASAWSHANQLPSGQQDWSGWIADPGRALLMASSLVSEPSAGGPSMDSSDPSMATMVPSTEVRDLEELLPDEFRGVVLHKHSAWGSHLVGESGRD